MCLIRVSRGLSENKMIKEDRSENYLSSRIISIEEAARKAATLKKRNKSIGLCHGGFDILHPGHIKHFESARKMCDCLFVSVTSDKFITARKGGNRPVFSELLRAYSVASIRYVDYVIISSSEKATEIIKKIKPAYYIKGYDFINKTTPGIMAERKMIESLGGKIKYTTDQKLSTTEIIKHIKDEIRREKILIVIDRDGTLIEHVPYLGREEGWINDIKLKKDVADFLIYVQTKFDTTKIVVSNQQGVARGYFSTKTVEDINRSINALLIEKGVAIDSWQYCPDVSKDYAAKCTETQNAKFKSQFIKEKTMRKPNPEMLLIALRELQLKKSDFDRIFVIGDSQDDADLAKSINAQFIHAANKVYESLKREFDLMVINSKSSLHHKPAQ